MPGSFQCSFPSWSGEPIVCLRSSRSTAAWLAISERQRYKGDRFWVWNPDICWRLEEVCREWWEILELEGNYITVWCPTITCHHFFRKPVSQRGARNVGNVVGEVDFEIKLQVTKNYLFHTRNWLSKTRFQFADRQRRVLRMKNSGTLLFLWFWSSKPVWDRDNMPNPYSLVFNSLCSQWDTRASNSLNRCLGKWSRKLT